MSDMSEPPAPAEPVPAPPTPAAAPAAREGSNVPAILLIAGGALIALGAFLPWITVRAPIVGTLSKSGMEGGDGVITLIAGVILVVVGVMHVSGKPAPLGLMGLAVLAAVVTAVVAGIDLADINNRIDEVTKGSPLVTGSVGAGIWATFVGAALGLVGAFRLPRRSRA